MKAAAVAGASALGLVVLLVPVIAGAMFVGQGAWPLGMAGASSAQAEVPEAMWDLYAEAAARFEIDPGLLAAVGKVECDHGRSPACSTPNSAGVGPMQFLVSTFVAWSWAAERPDPSPLDPHDAVFAAAAKLAADGAATNPSAALWSYNHSEAYVATVEAWALAYGWRPPDAAVLVEAALNHPRLVLRPDGASDVAAGGVDPRVLAVLLVAATRHELSAVGPFISGHAYFVAATARASNHAFGRAVDIGVVDGAPVSVDNRAALDVVRIVAALGDRLRPDEVGCPWPDEVAGVPSITDGHGSHLHLGFDR